jgi:hypothetical protein
MFKGNSCYPISPDGRKSIHEHDQLVKILERLDIDASRDFSFIEAKTGQDYQRDCAKLVSPVKKIRELLPNCRPELV